MPLLEAFLALALTMLSLAMVATLVVELLHRLSRTRAKDLKAMLGEFYDSELKGLVETELKKTGKALDEHKKKLIEKLVNNPLMSGEKLGKVKGRLRASLRPLTSLSTEDFFKRIAYTDVGKHVKAKTEEEIDEFVDALSRKYEEFGVAASDFFKRKAQFLSLVAGVIVAFALNVNALSVLQSYLDDPQLRASVVAQSEVIAAKHRKLIKDIEGKGAGVEGFENLDELKEYGESFKKDAESIGKMGAPIGYGRNVPPGRLWRDKDLGPWAKGFCILLWVVAVFGTGLLIGLGGPFWFNIVRKLTEAIQVARGASTAGGAQARGATSAAGPMEPNRDTFRKTGGRPPLLRTHAPLTSAAQPSTGPDNPAAAAAGAQPDGTPPR